MFKGAYPTLDKPRVKADGSNEGREPLAALSSGSVRCRLNALFRVVLDAVAGAVYRVDPSKPGHRARGDPHDAISMGVPLLRALQQSAPLMINPSVSCQLDREVEGLVARH